MNKQRRQALEKIAEAVEALRDELNVVKEQEESAYENLLERLQDGEIGAAMQAAIDALQNAYGALDEAVESIREAVE
jgi:uncharacterized protein Yka (UPF0111/DUF47 family)